MNMPMIKQVGAFEGETVEIKCVCKDGSTYYQRVTIPPKIVREEGPNWDKRTADLSHIKQDIKNLLE